MQFKIDYNHILHIMKYFIFTCVTILTLFLTYSNGSSQANHFAYIQSSFPDNKVRVFDTKTNSLVKTIAVGSAPSGSDIHPNGSKIIVANGNNDYLSVISTITNSVIYTIPCGNYPVCVKYHPDGSRFYVSHKLGNSVKVFNNMNHEIADIPMNSFLQQIVIKPDGSAMYVAAFNTDRVYVVNTLNNTIIDTIEAGDGPYSMAIKKDASKLYVSNNNTNTISVVNLYTNSIDTTIFVGTSPNGIELSLDDSKLYVCVGEENKVKVINTNTNSIIASINVGSFPNGIDLNPSENKIWVTNAHSGNVSIINSITDTLEAIITVAGNPYCTAANFINDYDFGCDLDQDSLALVALYNSTAGPNWYETWDLQQPVSSWYGVELTIGGCVGVLALNNNNLSGNIPFELGDLSSLTGLFLNGNNLSGSIPSELGALTNLDEFSLKENQLTGSIPPELGNLPNLQYLYLEENQLTGSIPPELGNLPVIRNLLLSSNRLSGSIPPELGSLSSLSMLYLSENQLTGSIPPELGSLHGLHSLNLSSNRISESIPPELGSLSNLTLLFLNGNQLTGSIPAELGSLSNLTNLFLNSNQLTGSIPPELGSFPNPHYLDLSFNQLEGCFPQTFTNFCNIDYYDFTNNPDLPWNGDFERFCNGENQIGAPCDDTNPNTIDDIITADCKCRGETFCDRVRDSLALVALYNSTDGPNWTNTWDLQQPMDTWYGVKINLEGCVDELQLFDNKLNGTVPSELGQLSNLSLLYLGKNPIIGEIPSELGNLSNLIELNLSVNHLTGEIPSELGQLSNLASLTLTGNELTGKIPSELGQLSNLASLTLAGNELTGKIPPELGQLANLTSLSLHVNQLAGEIPSELGQLQNLTRLQLYNNQLTGEIPSELGLLSKLTTLELENNLLGGLIPPALGLLTNLTALKLSSNQLKGEIPSELGQLTNLNTLQFGNNQLIGEIPPELGQLTKLRTLYINQNQLSGQIPPEFGQLSNLNYLTLSDNQLNGCFPQSYSIFCEINRHDFFNNPGLPWGGDFDRFCTGEEQIGAPCNDNNPNTINDVITPDCKCRGEIFCDRMRDSLALVALYNSTNGPNWTNTWNLLQPMTSWYGVTLNNEGCVITLNLEQNDLTGKLPPDLGNLVNLTRLKLNHNQISDSIPSELAGLKNLSWLHLHLNQLSGSIPHSLGLLTELTQLYLHNNQLSGKIPIEFGGLSNLEQLRLDNNILTGPIPPELGELTNLEIFYAHDNNLTGEIPSALGQLSALHRLYIHNNHLTGCFPEELLIHCDIGFSSNINIDGYNITGNPYLPWGGDFERFCNGEDQIGAPCDDIDQETENDLIRADCHCEGCRTFFSSTDTVLCPGEFLEVNGSIYTVSTIINDTTETMYGCDSIIHIQLTVLNSSDFMYEIDTTLCPDESIEVNNTEYNQSGEYNILIPGGAQYGCDSLVVLNLSIATITSVSYVIDTMFCPGESLEIGGIQYDQPGHYSITLPGATIHGCDSIVELNIAPLYENADAGSDQLLCLGDVVNLSANLPDMTSGNWSSDNPSLIFDDPNSPNTSANGLTPGLNIFTWSLTSTECPDFSSSIVEIFLQNSASVVEDHYIIPYDTDLSTFDPSDNDELFTISTWNIDILYQGGGGVIHPNGDGTFRFEPNHRFYGTFNAQYELCDVLCPEQCDIGEIVIEVLPPDDIEDLIPSGITPNGDGINDLFVIPAISFNSQLYVNNQLTILNRWGDVVFKAKPYQNDWGGTNMEGKELPQSTYYYVWNPGTGEKDVLGRVTILK